jgi:hypothetical protein
MPEGRTGRRLPVRLGLLVIVVLSGQMAGTALGSWSNAASASMTVSTATLAAATGLAAVNGNCGVLNHIYVDLSWTATSSTFADGYEIFRSTTNGGPYSSIATVAGRTTVTYTDTTTAFSTTYYYVVKAKKNNWRSVNSNQATVTTKSSLCL